MIVKWNQLKLKSAHRADFKGKGAAVHRNNTPRSTKCVTVWGPLVGRLRTVRPIESKDRHFKRRNKTQVLTSSSLAAAAAATCNN